MDILHILKRRKSTTKKWCQENNIRNEEDLKVFREKNKEFFFSNEMLAELKQLFVENTQMSIPVITTGPMTELPDEEIEEVTDSKPRKRKAKGVDNESK